MRLWAIGLSWAVAAAANAAAAGFDPFAGPKPLAIFIEQNPWLMVIGSDTPRVAVYENGDVVFTKKAADNRLVYHHTTLKPADLAALARSWTPLVDHPPAKKRFEISGATDQATAVLYLANGDRFAGLSVYGLSCTSTPPAPTNPKGDDAPPAALYELHKTFCTFDFASSREWTPKYVEVMLWDYSNAPAASIAWPKEWPGLTSERALKRGDAYSIFLNGDQLPKLNAFIAAQKEKGAVELAGKKWAISYRFTFPGEPIWRKALWSN